MINGFSAMGWSAAATSVAVRQTEQTFCQISQFIQNVITSGRDQWIGALQERSHLECPPRLEPIGLSWKNNFATPKSLEIATHPAGLSSVTELMALPQFAPVTGPMDQSFNSTSRTMLPPGIITHCQQTTKCQ